MTSMSHVFHKGYCTDVLTPLGYIASHETVRVYPHGSFLNPLYCTDTLERALRWIDAYVAGEQWAVNSRRRADRASIDRAADLKAIPAD